ncbi:MAG: hypothetical protein ACTSSK_16485, partial [Candidatus Heimdallarchaeota archaeon]
EEIPVLKLEESFEIPILAHTNTTLALNETIDLSLFNVSCHSLRFEYFTEEHDNFSVNNINLSLIYCYSEIKFLSNTSILCSSLLIYPDGRKLDGHIQLNYSELSHITRKTIFNTNNYSIILHWNIEIVEKMITVPDTTNPINNTSLSFIVIVSIMSYLIIKKKYCNGSNPKEK